MFPSCLSSVIHLFVHVFFVGVSANRKKCDKGKLCDSPSDVEVVSYGNSVSVFARHCGYSVLTYCKSCTAQMQSVGVVTQNPMSLSLAIV